MGEIRPAAPVLRLAAIFSGDEAALTFARDQIAAAWGPPALVSEPFAFDETDYYAATMGGPLRKQFIACQTLADPAELADWKQTSNAWEAEYAQAHSGEVARPVNIDPGYLDRGKLLLASTKDHAHRIYLRDGVFAETTLYYRDKAWRAREWTFPDYRRADYHVFFEACRNYYRQALASRDGG